MSTYTLTHCTVADGAALSRNNMSAFWQDPSWRLAWRHRTLEQHIAEQAKRYPRSLLRDRATTRHQQAVDPATGALLGYCRWVLPASCVRSGGGNSTGMADDAASAAGAVWPEAVVPAVAADEEAEIQRVAAAAVFDPDTSSDPLDQALQPTKKEILARKEYIILDYLAVHPDNQGKGVATALVQSGVTKAAQLGLDIFVLAFRAGINVYKRAGFRVERELVQDDSMYGGPGEFRVCFMVYEHKMNTEV